LGNDFWKIDLQKKFQPERCIDAPLNRRNKQGNIIGSIEQLFSSLKTQT